METVTLPKGVRNRWFYVIVMPLTADGNGPASEENGEIRKLTWEVWNQFCDVFGSFDCLPDAIDKAEELNAEMLQWENKDS